MTTSDPIAGTDRVLVFTYVEPPRPDGGPRRARADLIEYSIEIDDNGARDVGRRIVRSGLVLLDDAAQS